MASTAEEAIKRDVTFKQIQKELQELNLESQVREDLKRRGVKMPLEVEGVKTKISEATLQKVASVHTRMLAAGQMMVSPDFEFLFRLLNDLLDENLDFQNENQNLRTKLDGLVMEMLKGVIRPRDSSSYPSLRY